MNEAKLIEFVGKLVESTEKGEIEWSELEFDEISLILRKVSSFARIVGAFSSKSNKHNKLSVLGKYTVNVYYEEDRYTEEEYIFLAISDPKDYLNSIVITEDEFPELASRKLFKLYRNVELDTNKISDILNTWFDD